MIPNRLLLRAATVLALTRGGNGPFPTMAGEAVFDTKLAPISETLQEGMTPVVIVYTDADTRENKDKNATRTWRRKIDLIIEIAIGSATPGPEGKTLEWIETDAEMEALLDLFELEVEVALNDPLSPWSANWRKLLRCFDQYTSAPYRTAEQSARYAVRQLHFAVEVNSDCFPTVTTGARDLVVCHDANGDFIPGSLLPVPYLEALERIIGNTSNEIFENVRGLLTGASQQVVAPPLKRAKFKVDAIDPADPNRLAVGQTKGPDGRIEIEAHIEGLDKQ